MTDGAVEDPVQGLASLLWPTAFVVMWLAAHAAFGYLRLAGRANGPRARGAFVAVAAAALGLGIGATALLGISGTTMGFEAGYGVLALVAAGGICLATGLATALLLARWHRPWVMVVAGALLGTGVLLAAVQCVRALGLQPGPQFGQHGEALALAWPLAASGSIAGFWIALLAGGRAGAHRRLWRWVASTLVALAVVLCNALVVGAAGLEGQTGSVHEREIPAVAVSLAAAVGVPLLLAGALVDLGMRHLRPANTAIAPRKRRRLKRGPML
jgi:hypothetical protein